MLRISISSKVKKVGIIAAMQEEMEAIKVIMEDILEEKIHGLTFITGKINNKEVVQHRF